MAFGKKAAAAVIAVAPEVGPLGSFVDGVAGLLGNADVDGDGECKEKLINMMPRDKGELEELILSGAANVFDWHMEGAHGTTDVEKWRRQEPGSMRELSCMKSDRYEPYFVLRNCKETPPYQDAFMGYGKNKIEYVLHVRKLIYDFHSVGREFVVHWPHGKSESKKSWLDARERGGKRGQHKKVDLLFELFNIWLVKNILTEETPRCVERGVKKKLWTIFGGEGED